MEEKNKKKHTRFSDYIAFAVALLAAFTLWIYAIGFDSTVFTRTVDDVAVEIVGASELAASNGFTLKDRLSISITVTISGKRADISAVKNSDITAVIDISNVTKAGNNSIPIAVTVPNGTNLVEQSSVEAVLFLDKYITKYIPVTASHTISAIASGVMIGSETCNPSFITVSGPESELENIEYAYARYSVIELSGTTVAHCAPELVNSDGSSVNNPYITTDVQDVVVTLEAYKVKELPVNVVFTGGKIDISLATVTTDRQYISVKGDVDVVDALNSLTIRVDESGYTEGFSLDVLSSTLLPDKVALADGAPSVIHVDITLPQISSVTVYVAPEDITLSGGDGTLKASEGLYVKLNGITTALAGLTADDLTVTVKAAELFDGEDGKPCGEAAVATKIPGTYVSGEYYVYFEAASADDASQG